MEPTTGSSVDYQLCFNLEKVEELALQSDFCIMELRYLVHILYMVIPSDMNLLHLLKT